MRITIISSKQIHNFTVQSKLVVTIASLSVNLLRPMLLTSSYYVNGVSYDRNSFLDINYKQDLIQ